MRHAILLGLVLGWRNPCGIVRFIDALYITRTHLNLTESSLLRDSIDGFNCAG